MGGARTRVLPVSRNRHRVRKRRRIDPRRPARAGRREGFPAVAVPVVRASPVTSLRLVDLSHEIEAGKITYTALPPPVVSDVLSCLGYGPQYFESETVSLPPPAASGPNADPDQSAFLPL